MSEKSPGSRLTPKGVLLTGLAVGAAALIATGAENSGERDTVTISVNAKALRTPNPIQHVRGLARGDKIDELTMIVPEKHLDDNFTYAPKQKGGTEDLAVVYSPKLDELMIESSGGPHINYEDYHHKTGVLLTSFPSGILESLVTFNDETREVESIVQSLPIPRRESSLYGPLPFSLTRLGFGVDAVPIDTPNGNGVRLSIKDVPPPPMGQSS